jgi:hypothetical protein
MNTTINLSCAGLIAAALCCAHLLDGPSDWEAVRDSVDEVRAAEAQAQAQQRFERAARAACGENSGWQVRSDGALQCTTKRGHPTIIAAGVVL